MVCAYRLGFPSGTPLSGGAGLGFLNFLALRHLRGRYANVIEKITIASILVDKFREICVSIPFRGQDGYKKRKLSEVKP